MKQNDLQWLERLFLGNRRSTTLVDEIVMTETHETQ
jgi:hypothetical protein